MLLRTRLPVRKKDSSLFWKPTLPNSMWNREWINDFRKITVGREIPIRCGMDIPTSLDFVYFSDTFNIEKWSEQERNEGHLMCLNASPFYHNHPPHIWCNWYSISSVGDGLPRTFIWQLDLIIYCFTCITNFPHSPLDKQTVSVLNLFNLFFQSQCLPSTFW